MPRLSALKQRILNELNRVVNKMRPLGHIDDVRFVAAPFPFPANRAGIESCMPPPACLLELKYESKTSSMRSRGIRTSCPASPMIMRCAPRVKPPA